MIITENFPLPLQELAARSGGAPAIDGNSILVLADWPASFWLKLDVSTRIVKGTLEGKLHIPARSNGRLFLFEPGFPGRGSADLEKSHVKQLTDAGYTVFAPRHNGMLLTGKHSDFYISCPERQAKAGQEGQVVLGDGPYTELDKWLLEPLIAIEALSACFEETVLLGHSFGGLALMYSAVKYFAESPGHNIKRLISMAGATGRIRSDSDRIVEMWTEYIDTEYIRERVSIGKAEDNLRHLRHAYGLIHEKIKVLPDQVELLCLHPWGDSHDSIDELIGVNEPLELILSLGRGTLVVDKTQKAEPSLEQLAHDMCGLSSAALLKLLDTTWKSDKQILQLDNSGIH